MELGTNWKKLLGKAVNTAESVGVSEDRVEDLTYRFGHFFVNKVDPTDREQRLLKDLWEEGSEEEKRSLAAMFSRLSEKGVADEDI